MARNPLGEPSPVANVNARTIVNANYGISNIVDIDETEDAITRALRQCEDVLKKHCGPLSGYAMLIDQAGSGIDFRPSIFTRDGIRILRSVDTVSPLETYVKDMLTYIGTRVDNYAKDGTTTSMLFAACFIRYILERKKDLPHLSNYEYILATQEVIDAFEESLKKFTFDVERFAGKKGKLTEAEEMKVAGEIAFCQTLSSSGGDLDLALTMKKIFEASPRVTWDFITYHNSPKETDKPFYVEVPDYDIKLRCHLATNGAKVYNRAVGSEYLAQNIRTIVSSDGLIAGSTKVESLIKYIQTYPDDEPLAIIAPAFNNEITMMIDDLNSTRKNPISLWMYVTTTMLSGSSYAWELMITNAICGCEPYNTVCTNGKEFSDEFTFIAKELSFHDGCLYITSSVEPLKDSCIHPYYANPEIATEYYKDVLHMIQDQIDAYTNGHKPDGTTLQYYIEMLNRICCVHRPTLLLGGTVHEQIANAEVANDVLGAIMSTLKHGSTINGCLSALLAAHRTLQLLAVRNDDNTRMRQFKDILIDGIVEGLELVVNTTYTDDTNPDVKAPYVEFLTSTVYDDADNVCNSKNYVNVFGGCCDLDTFRKEYMNTGDAVKYYPVMHPVGIYTEMMKRAREILLKFILTNQIIVHGGVVLNDEAKSQPK